MKLIIQEHGQFKYLNEKMGELSGKADENSGLVMVNSKQEGIEKLLKLAEEIFAPINFVMDQWEHVKNRDVLVYFPLSAITGATKMLTVLKENQLNKNGVFRLRRRQHQLNPEWISSNDIYFLSSIFGRWKTLYPKLVHSSEANISHMLVAVTFENNVMAQLEYTFTRTGRELLEMEWSGRDHVLEYSTEQKALQTVTDGEQEAHLDYDDFLVTNESMSLSEEMYIELNRLREAISLELAGGVK
ncbi:hypothetical protein J7E71_19430 [Mesobacillus foraminis]|uniref:hypothetical protein n=1 Tax=Mesobacillus foraminis TaxID=279826 RepID=UPI001BEC5B60|nr:hypothetical protein [Mesobacillus foraminis]MBT2758046.1 hypothetical protein [Mesobacillus foraminis]